MLTWLCTRNASRLNTEQIERQPDREIGADRRIHRDQRALRRLREARAARDDAVDDRLAVLRFADLEIRRVGGGLDEIAGGIDAEQPRRFGADLAAEDQRGVELDACDPCSASASRRCTSRNASPTCRAASNMLAARENAGLRPRSRCARAACSIDRLRNREIARASSATSTRSPGCSKTVILRNVLI